MSNGYNGILVVVDMLSKYAHFILLVYPYTAKSMARLFVEYIIKLYGPPRSIISDRDRIFISNFWKEFFRLQGTQLSMSSVYHSQIDGQSEVTNRTLEQYLRCYVHQNPRRWEDFIPWAEYWYNTTYHASTKCTPFELVYGCPSPSLTSYPEGDSPNAEVDHELKEQDIMLQELKQILGASIRRMKEYYDKNRREEEFAVGDWVFLKLRPYRQKSISQKAWNKLVHDFMGHSRCEKKLGRLLISWICRKSHKYIW